MQSTKFCRLSWLKYLVGETFTCPTLPVTVRPDAKVTLPTYYKVKQPSPIYSLFPHSRYAPIAYGANYKNELEAVKSRVIKQTPKVDTAEMRRFTQWVKGNYTHLFPEFRRRRPWNITDYLKNSNASPAVKRTILEARKRLESDGVTEDTTLSPNELHKFTIRKSFVKVEFNLYKTPRGVAEKAPRLIQGASPEFIALVGPTFCAIQKEICRVWGKKSHCYFTSGATTMQASKYILEPQGWLWFENDVSAFDASVSYDLGLLECWLARKMGARQCVVDLMRANLRTHGYTSHGIHYKVRGTRKSGDPYTSCFNSVLNGLMHLYSLSVGRDVRTVLPLVRMLVQGDDNLLRHSPALKPDWGCLLKLGFKCDNLYRDGPETAEFCSSKFYPIRGGWCLAPKLARVLNKMCWFVNPPMNIDPHSVVRGVAIGFGALRDMVPHLSVVIDRILELTVGRVPYFIRDGDWKMQLSGGVSRTAGYEYCLWLWYGLNTSMQDDCGRVLRRLEFGKNFTTSYFDLLFDKETIGPKLIF